jgi:L-seryl-tRNA(Ser) seleniumtransferase
VADGLADLPVECRLITPTDSQSPPVLQIAVGVELSRSAMDVCRRLRHGSPPVYVGHGLLDQEKIVIHPLHLNELRTTKLLRRLREELTP